MSPKVETRGQAADGAGIMARCALIFGLALLSACASDPKMTPPVEPEDAGAYDYPLLDPLAATIIGTPVNFQARVPEGYRVREEKLAVIPERTIPEVFWYQDGLEYSLAPQPGPAPLVFIIAGTGAGHRADLMEFFEALLVQRGLHVVLLPSPTHPNFVINASGTSVPGRPRQDAADLYRVMRMIAEDLREDVEVTGYHLMGYSLGALQAAFVAELDEREGAFGFDKVLMLNPAVGIFDSVEQLDALLIESLPGGIDGVGPFIDQAFDAFLEIYRHSEAVDFSDDFLFLAYRKLNPKEEALGAVIGLVFRFAANNMVFTADVMADLGYIVPKGAVLATSSSLTDYFRVGARRSFVDYIDEIVLPYYAAREPGLDRERLIAASSLKSIAGYLKASGKFGVITNEDDIILTPGDLDFLEQVFGPRLEVFPSGGHLGNLKHAHVAAKVGAFFGD